MAQHIVNAPDGTQHIINAPDGATPDQIIAYAQQTIPKSSGQAGSAGAAFGEGLPGAVPFGGVISSGLGAVGAKVYDRLSGDDDLNGQSVPDLYNQAQANSKATAAAHPVASVAGNLTGIATTLPLVSGKAILGDVPTEGIRGAINQIPQALAAVGDFVRGGETAGDAGLAARAGNQALQSGKAAIVAAPVGALYGAGDANAGHRLHGAELGAGLAAGTSLALPVVGAAAGGLVNTGKGIVARGADALEADGSQLYSDAGDLYNRMRAAGAVLNPEASGTLSSKIGAALNNPTFIPELNPKTTAIVNKIQAVADQGQIGLGDLDQYRRLLGRIGNTEDGVSANAVRTAIDNHVNGLTGSDLLNGDASAVDLLNKGRATYAQASKFDDISNILQNAAGDPNKIKAGLTRFLNKDSNTRGWSDDEIQALQNAAQTGTVEKLLKMGGKFGVDLGTSLTPGNTIGPIVGSAVAGAHSGGVGAIVAPVAGTIARQGQKYLARGKAENLLQTIEAGVPAPQLSTIIPTFTGPPTAAQAANIPLQELLRMPTEKAQEYLNAMKLRK